MVSKLHQVTSSNLLAIPMPTLAINPPAYHLIPHTSNLKPHTSYLEQKNSTRESKPLVLLTLSRQAIPSPYPFAFNEHKPGELSKTHLPSMPLEYAWQFTHAAVYVAMGLMPFGFTQSAQIAQVALSRLRPETFTVIACYLRRQKRIVCLYCIGYGLILRQRQHRQASGFKSIRLIATNGRLEYLYSLHVLVR